MSDQVVPFARRSGRSAPTLPQLRAFVALCEMRHFGAAARRLGIGQSSLSEAFAALEASVGARLVERSPRRIVVTPEGRRLLPHAQAAVAAADAFELAAAGLGALLSGPLRIGLIPTVAPYLLPALLARLGRAAPALELHVREDQTETLLTALRGGDVDAAVLALPAAEEGIDELALYDEEFVVVVPAGHPWAGRRTSRRRRSAAPACCCWSPATACATRRSRSAEQGTAGRARRARATRSAPSRCRRSSSSSPAGSASPCCRRARSGSRRAARGSRQPASPASRRPAAASASPSAPAPAASRSGRSWRASSAPPSRRARLPVRIAG